MIIKKTLAAAALAVLCTPAFAQPLVFTAAQCLEAGGEINQVDGTCVISEEDLAAYLETSGAAGTAAAGTAATAAAVGGGIGGGAIALGGLVVVLGAAGGGSSSATTTTD